MSYPPFEPLPLPGWLRNETAAFRRVVAMTASRAELEAWLGRFYAPLATTSEGSGRGMRPEDAPPTAAPPSLIHEHKGRKPTTRSARDGPS